MKRLFAVLAVAAALAACSSTPKEQEGAKVEDRQPTVSQPTKPSTDARTGPLTSQGPAVNPLKDPNNILSKRSVFFDYDQFVVKDEFKPMVTAHAKYLASNRSAHVTVQGNTDERGSREYNLALGQKRADAVKQMMTLSGATSQQIETVSFGEEKPRAQGQTEQAFAENRRADIVYQGE